MKFLCDVHISYKIVKHLLSLGFEAIHVNAVLERWHTKDGDICIYADKNDLIVLTKDADFRNSFLINNTPKKLVKINLGNISNSVLLDVISENMVVMQKLNANSGFMLELNLDSAILITRDL